MHKKNGKGKNGGMNKRVSVDREDPKNIGKGGKKSNKMHQNGNGLTAAQRKLPPALQKAIMKSKKKKK